MTKQTKPYLDKLRMAWSVLKHFLPWMPRSKWGRRLTVGVLALAIIAVGAMYGISRWYVYSVRDTPQVVGASFIADYARSLGVDPEETMDGMINDLGIKHFRLVSYWNKIEATQGTYDFSELDWQFAKAEAAGAKVTLSLGLRQPRWPECHPPTWVDTSRPTGEWQPALENFMTAVVNRYKDSPALDSYQVENEYFLTAFGECKNFDRQRLIDEFNLVKKLDPQHPAIVNRSNNGLGIPVHAPTADTYGVSIYKRVWDSSLTKRYLEYPQPAWYYSFMAGVQKISQDRDMIVHEMQAEAWAPDGKTLVETSLAEQNKSLDAKRLAGRFEYGRDTGLREVYMWGAEYWYYRKQVLNDPSLWDAARDGYANAR
jgi:hypothetical protein